MVPFSYYPSFTDARAEKLGVANRKSMLELIASPKHRLLVKSGYGFAVACPEVRPLAPDEARELENAVAEHFDLVETWPRFGQARTPLEFWVRKDTPPAEAEK